MIELTVAELRNKTDLLRRGDIVHLNDGRKREGIGYFIPERYYEALQGTVEKIEREKRKELLGRIALAQKADPVEEGTAGDGIL
jgi:hypothetical protein